MRISRLLATLAASISAVTASSSIRNPLRTITALRDASILTPDHRIHSLSHFDIAFELYGRPIRLSLQPSHDIFPEGATVTYVNSEGETISEEPLDPLEHKVYKGTAWARNMENAWAKLGWTRIYVYDDGVYPMFEGVFSLNQNHHHIQLNSKYMQTRMAEDPVIDSRDDRDFMVLWRDSDLSPVKHDNGRIELRRRDEGEGSHACSVDKLDFNPLDYDLINDELVRRSPSPFSIRSIFGRQDTPTSGNSGVANLQSTIGNKNGCPTMRKVALVGVVADCGYLKTFNTTETARNHIIQAMNSASAVYETTFDITLGLRNLTVLTPPDGSTDCPQTAPATFPFNEPCSVNGDLQVRLNKFSQWRGTLTDTNSHWTLLSTCGQGAAVGLAWPGQLCKDGAQAVNGSDGSAQVVAGANVVIKTANSEWQIIAHETGHTFGAVHDCTSETCNDGTSVAQQKCCPLSSTTCDANQMYIMNPSTGTGITAFSPCSIGNICSAMLRNSVKTTCLTNNRGVTTITGQQCGNGIVEEGEQCDCGGEEGCGTNACCDPKTCKFKNNAVCDDSNEECCKNCQLAPSTVVCRNSTSSCDPEEKCSGSSPTCPSDITLPDGQDCGGGLKCASGQCTSRDQQCSEVLGTYLSGNQTYSCDPDLCTISCTSAKVGADTCVHMSQNFLDGSDCGYGGKCSNGICQGSNVMNKVKEWILKHKALVIGLAAGIGGLLILLILSCIYNCFRRRRIARKQPYFPYYPPATSGATGSRSGRRSSRRVRPDVNTESQGALMRNVQQSSPVQPAWQPQHPASPVYRSERYA